MRSGFVRPDRKAYILVKVTLWEDYTPRAYTVSVLVIHVPAFIYTVNVQIILNKLLDLYMSYVLVTFLKTLVEPCQ